MSFGRGSWGLLDLGRQVRDLLLPRNGGFGNGHGWGRGVLYAGFNSTGSTIPLYTLVRSTGKSDTVEPTTAANETDVLGVCVGYIDGDGVLVEADAPSGGPCAVLVSGVCQVLVSGLISRGQFAASSSTAGKAIGSGTAAAGLFGQFLSGGTSGYTATVRLYGPGGALGAVAALPIAHSATTGRTVNDHHAEVHSATGSDHTFPGGTTDYLRADGTWATPPGSGDVWTTVTKASDETRISNNTVSNDAELLFATTSGHVYYVECFFIFDGPAAGDIKIALGEDGTARGVIDMIGLSTADSGQQSIMQCQNNSAIGFGSAASKRALVGRGYILGNGGTFRLLWAQNTSTASTTTVRAGSYFRFRDIA